MTWFASNFKVWLRPCTQSLKYLSCFQPITGADPSQLTIPASKVPLTQSHDNTLSSTCPVEVFHKQYAELSETIQKPDLLAARLFAKGFITIDTKNRVSLDHGPCKKKSITLLNALEDNLLESSDQKEWMQSLCTVLEVDSGEPALGKIAAYMKVCITGQ